MLPEWAPSQTPITTVKPESPPLFHLRRNHICHTCSETATVQVQLLAIYLANLARMLKPQGASHLVELEYATTFAAQHIEGWELLSFIQSGGQCVKPSVVDVKAMAAGKAAAPEKLQLEQVGQWITHWRVTVSRGG